MKTITVAKSLLNPISLPGMGRSVELSQVSEQELLAIRAAFTQHNLYIEFVEEPGQSFRVNQIWGNPHAPQITLFI